MLTVMFSSRNGSPVLGKTLTAMAAAHEPRGGWKLVAVDNASTDATGKIIESYRDRLPLTLLGEPECGKNRALNRALGHAEGDLFIFCDDDVVVAPDWLVRWRQVADEHPKYALFAGASEPLWPCKPPRWVLEEVDPGIVFATNGHMRDGPCNALAIFGPNMAIRAALFDDGIRFNADIGPGNSPAYPMGSETELVRRLAGLGHKSWFTTAPRVCHIIRPQQMERQAIVMRGYRWGRGQAHMQIPHTYMPRRLSRKTLLRWGLYPMLMLLYSHREAWARQWEWAIDQGYEDGLREREGAPPRWICADGKAHIARRFRLGAV